MKRLFFTAMLMMSCVSDPNAPPARWARDEVFCWYKDNYDRWQHHGLAHECPPDAPMGGPTAVIK